MDNDSRQRASARRILAGRVLLAVGAAALAILPGLWPLLFLALPGMLIASLPALAGRKVRNSGGQNEKAGDKDGQERTGTNTGNDSVCDPKKEAYRNFLRQVDSLVSEDHPGAAWIWETPHAEEQFRKRQRLFLLLNRAGGYRRAEVCYAGSQALSIDYQPDAHGQEDAQQPGPRQPAETGMPESHSLLAFQWTQANREKLEQRRRAAEALGRGEILVPACDLPCPESWGDICAEIDRAGAGTAAAGTDGIWILLPYQEQKGKTAA